MSIPQAQIGFFSTKQHQILVCNNNSYVTIPTTHNKSFSYLVDTGASLSACKYKHVLELNIPIHKENLIINGLGGKVQSIGFVYITLYLGTQKVKHKFYIFKTLPIQSTAILGRDFLNKYKAKLDFQDHNMTLQTNSNYKICIPFTSYCNEVISVPKRSESIHYIQTDFISDGVVCPQELQNGIFLAGAIVRPKNGVIPVKILNVTESDLLLSKISPTILKLDDYHACEFDKNTKNADRVKSLFTKLNLEHLNSEERITIENLCAKYADIFYLPGDKLSTTDIYTHTITVKPNTKPIFTKSYRLPYSHKQEVKS